MYLQISRKFSISCLMLGRLSKRRNPGLDYQMSALEDAVEVIKSDPEGFVDMESDFTNVHKSFKQHELELQHARDKIKKYIIKKKYFPQDQLPNLLTYAEKQQIKFLHSTDDEEWTLEKLSDSFPASVETISKIIRSNWIPMSSKRILSHDKGVLNNWERLKKGEFRETICPEVHDHLMKFKNRDIKDLNNLQDNTQTCEKPHWQKPKSNEFSTIITSLRTKENNLKDITMSNVLPQNNIKKPSESTDFDTYTLGKIRNKNPITIHELKDKHLIENYNYTKGDKFLNKTASQNLTENTTGTICKETTSSATSLDYTEKFTSNEVVISEADRKRYGMCASKERVHIPRKLWKRGATYRANDCYYDDDGEFLFRVPGMFFS